jgi:sulfur relay protein TusB/DsrH
MKILHVIKEKDHDLALSTALGQREDSSNDITLLLIHDAVLTREDSLEGLKVLALKDDAGARGIKPVFPLIDYQEMLKLIFDSDKVICW